MSHAATNICLIIMIIEEVLPFRQPPCRSLAAEINGVQRGRPIGRTAAEDQFLCLPVGPGSCPNGLVYREAMRDHAAQRWAGVASSGLFTGHAGSATQDLRFRYRLG